MAIQKVNLGSEPLGEGGDTNRSANIKINENFSNTAHAASRLVGTATGQIPLAEDVRSASAKVAAINNRTSTDFDLNTMKAGDFLWLDGDNINSPYDLMKGSLMSVECFHNYQTGRYVQLAICIGNSASMEWAVRGNHTGGDRGWSDWAVFYSSGNTTKDSNGFIKASSPVIDLYDNKIELNGDATAQGVEFIKNGTGDYTLKTKTGLRSDNTWQIEVPQDNNKNPLLAVDIDAQEDGTINIKCYKRIFSMETFLFGPDFNEPMDITEGRFISVRLNDNPEEELDEHEPEEEPTVDEVVEPEEEEPTEEFK